jgi:hypothetical protein
MESTATSPPYRLHSPTTRTASPFCPGRPISNALLKTSHHPLRNASSSRLTGLELASSTQHQRRVHSPETRSDTSSPLDHDGSATRPEVWGDLLKRVRLRRHCTKERFHVVSEPGLRPNGWTKREGRVNSHFWVCLSAPACHGFILSLKGSCLQQSRGGSIYRKCSCRKSVTMGQKVPALDTLCPDSRTTC